MNVRVGGTCWIGFFYMDRETAVDVYKHKYTVRGTSSSRQSMCSILASPFPLVSCRWIWRDLASLEAQAEDWHASIPVALSSFVCKPVIDELGSVPPSPPPQFKKYYSDPRVLNFLIFGAGGGGERGVRESQSISWFLKLFFWGGSKTDRIGRISDDLSPKQSG